MLTSGSSSGGSSTGPDGNASVTGGFAGAPAAVGTLRVAVAGIDTSAGIAHVSVDVTNEAAACDAIVNSGGFPSDATVLQLNVGVFPNDVLPTPGTYTISTSATSGPWANAQYLSLVGTDAGCAQAAGASVSQSSGTITLTSVSADSVSGSFDLRFFQNSVQGQPANFDHVSGQFTAPACVLRDPSPSPILCGGFSTQ